MTGLFIDTATEQGSVALYDGDRMVSSATLPHQLNHLQTLHPAVEQVLNEAHSTIHKMDYFGVDIGPGSFTGIRIGVTAIRTLCQLSGKPCFSASSLDILCCQAQGFRGLLVPLIDGKKNSIYTAIFRFDREKLRRESDYRDISPEALTSLLNRENKTGEKVLFLGNGQERCKDHFQGLDFEYALTGKDHYFPHAREMFFLMKEGSLSTDWEGIRPFYLRPSDAESGGRVIC